MFIFRQKSVGFYLKSITILLGCISTLFIVACTPANQNVPRTNVVPPQQAQMVLAEGVTTQQQVQQSFGLPDYVSRDQQDNEVWTYQRHATISAQQANRRGFTVILYTQNSFSNQASQSQTSEQLMITFDVNKTVIGYEVSASLFSAE